MKKKTIEMIPYLGLPRLIKKKVVRYTAVAAVREIGQEEHLIVEVYRNKKECREVPKARIVVTAKDFGTYFPGTGTWSRALIYANGRTTYPELIWREDDTFQTSAGPADKQDILYSAEDLERIQEFTRDISVLRESAWWEYLKRKQESIASRERNERSRRAYEKRQQALKDRQKNTQELPEEKTLRYADTILFHGEHHLYYKKNGAWARVACSKCGGVTDARWKPGQSFESQFEKMIEEPRMGHYGVCPMCGAHGKYIAQGRAKNFSRVEGYLFLGQRYKENGMVLRYVNVKKEWQVGMICGGNSLEMYNSREKISGIEIARVYFEPGKKIQKDYHKHDPYSGKDFWDDCNLYGQANINIKEARIMPETFKNMKGTFLQYSALEEYQDAKGTINPVDYLERYIQTPQMEMLVKMGLTGVADELVRCRYGIVADEDAKRADAFLGIRKERIKQLVRHRGDINILKVMKMEENMDRRWTEEQIEQLGELEMDYQVDVALEYMGIQQFLNRVAKYAGCRYGTMCGTAESRLRQTALTYIDYLTMRKEQGYDLQNTVYLFPRDLTAAHAKMVMEHNKVEADKRVIEVNARFPLIQKHYRRLLKKFYYENGDFLIRPARDAGEIVMEGRFLHHCVGRDAYLEKHNTGKSTILFLRSKEEPEIPYITVEIETASLHIRQWYGARDTKPDEKRMQKWLDGYVTRLICGGIAAGMESQEETAMQIVAYA